MALADCLIEAAVKPRPANAFCIMDFRAERPFSELGLVCVAPLVTTGKTSARALNAAHEFIPITWTVLMDFRARS
ncbi:hypothetical protein [Caballeronia sp. KNU42]